MNRYELFQGIFRQSSEDIDARLDEWATSAGLDHEINEIFLGLNHLLSELSRKQMELEIDRTDFENKFYCKEADSVFNHLRYLFQCAPYLRRLLAIYESQTRTDEYQADRELRKTVDGLVAMIRDTLTGNLSIFDQHTATIREALAGFQYDDQTH